MFSATTKRPVLFLSLMGSLLAPAAHAQGIGTTEFAATGTSAGTRLSVAETLYIGPGTYTTNGNWEVYSHYVYISKDAILNGTGTIKFFDPALQTGGASYPNSIDGNNNTNAIATALEIQNPQNVAQADIALPSIPATAGWVDAPGNANVYIGNKISFGVDLGDWLTNAFKLRLTAAATFQNYSSSRYVATNNNAGELIKEWSGSSSFFFPIGANDGTVITADYVPVILQPTSGTPGAYHLNAHMFDYIASPVDITELDNSAYGNMQHTWLIYADNAGTAANITLLHDNSYGNAGYDVMMARVVGYNGTNWIGVGLTTTETLGTSFIPTDPNATNYYGSTGTHAISTSPSVPMSFYSKNFFTTPLPATLQYFTGTASGCDAALSWVTTMEKNFSAFELQYAAAAKDFITIATMKAAGKDNSSNYKFSYAQPDDNGWYRLKMINTNGTFAYSPTARVIRNCGNSSPVFLYPNPATDAITLNGLSSAQTLKLINSQGQVVKSMMARQSSATLDISGLPTGIYFIMMDGESNADRHYTFVKQ